MLHERALTLSSTQPDHCFLPAPWRRTGSHSSEQNSVSIMLPLNLERWGWQVRTGSPRHSPRQSGQDVALCRVTGGGGRPGAALPSPGAEGGTGRASRGAAGGLHQARPGPAGTGPPPQTKPARVAHSLGPQARLLQHIQVRVKRLVPPPPPAGWHWGPGGPVSRGARGCYYTTFGQQDHDGNFKLWLDLLFLIDKLTISNQFERLARCSWPGATIPGPPASSWSGCCPCPGPPGSSSAAM